AVDDRVVGRIEEPLSIEAETVEDRPADEFGNQRQTLRIATGRAIEDVVAEARTISQDVASVVLAIELRTVDRDPIAEFAEQGDPVGPAAVIEDTRFEACMAGTEPRTFVTRRSIDLELEGQVLIRAG